MPALGLFCSAEDLHLPVMLVCTYDFSTHSLSVNFTGSLCSCFTSTDTLSLVHTSQNAVLFPVGKWHPAHHPQCRLLLQMPVLLPSSSSSFSLLFFLLLLVLLLLSFLTFSLSYSFSFFSGWPVELPYDSITTVPLAYS